MARPWSEVASDPNFQALPPAAQEQARQAYFQQTVLPNIPKGADPAAIKAQFDAHTSTVASNPDVAAQGAQVPQVTAPAMGENPSKLSEYGGAAARVIGGAIHDIPDALASGVSHVASSVLAPPVALAARTGAAITGNSPEAAANAVHNWFDTKGTYHAQTPGGQALENDVGAAGRVVSAPFASAGGKDWRAAGPTAASVDSGVGLANDVVGSTRARRRQGCDRAIRN